MIEIILERWIGPQGRTDHLWSVWRDGKRAEMGGPHDSADAAETAARRFCLGAYQQEPDRVTRL